MGAPGTRAAAQLQPGDLSGAKHPAQPKALFAAPMAVLQWCRHISSEHAAPATKAVKPCFRVLGSGLDGMQQRFPELQTCFFFLPRSYCMRPG